jgi:uncharacterized protein (DUF885 family)
VTEPRPAQASAVDALATRFWEAVLELTPTTATMYGDDRYDDRLEDPGPVGRARARAMYEAYLTESGQMDPSTLGVEDRITLDMIRVVCELGIEQDDQRVHELRVVDQIGGPQTLLPQVIQFQVADTPERLARLLERLRAYGPFMEANIGILRDGMASGLTAPTIVAQRTAEQLERLLAVPIGAAVIPQLARVAGEDAREEVREVVRDVVYPADAEFLRVLKEEYLPATRAEPGLWSAPDGDALYRTQIRAWTTLDIDPTAVHRIGLDELAVIEEEQRSICRSAGLGDDLVAYRRRLSGDPSNHPSSADELLARAAEDIARGLAAAPAYFGRLPRASCEVRAVEAFKEKDAPFAYYYPPTTDGSRPGIYYANTYDLPSRMYSTLATTTYHEAVPGHHFQIALEMENPHLNVFRRLGSRMVGGAYVEGWGLYAERLADEMGLFRNEQERFGMLTAQAWRAARLVVDSGIHALRWSRQQSIDFLLGAGLTETDAVIETDRYIAWPAQALTYMLGQLEIRRLRTQLEARDGAAFDLPAFHDEVLGHGSLPLATLARELPDWVTTPA